MGNDLYVAGVPFSCSSIFPEYVPEVVRHVVSTFAFHGISFHGGIELLQK